MVEITFTFLVDVEADSAEEAERAAQAMLDNDQIDLADPTSYRVADRGAGSWDD
jgi:predicted nucleic acid-binding protein